MPEPVAPVTGATADEPAPEVAAVPVVPRARGPRAARYRATWVRRSLESGPVDVTVCIANWNCRDMLRACLESLHDQPQGVRLETVVVDNGSADGAADMVAREFPEVVLQRNAANLGFARANNQAAGRARGRFLFFLNNDTLVPPGTLRRLVEYAEAHPEVGMVGPRLRDGRGQPQVSYRQRPTLAVLLHRTSLLRWTGLLREPYHRYRRQEFDPDSTRAVEVLMGAAMFLPRDVFRACGGWDEDFTFGGEDLDLSLRVGRSRTVVYHPRAEITHYGRVSTRQHIGYASTHMAVGFARYLRKSGCPARGLLAYKVLVSLDAPVQLVIKGVQYLWRRAQGQDAKAEKSLLAFRGLGHFLLRGLLTFWRA
jgi:GT2 family glycosyltransferase